MLTEATDYTKCNSMLVEIPYSTVLHAIEDTDSAPFTMTIRCQAEWSAIAQCVNQGIDTHLEACNLKGRDRFDNGDCSVTAHSLCVLLRRLGDTNFRATDEHTADEIWDAATSLQSDILMVLGIDDDGQYIGREAMGLE